MKRKIFNAAVKWAVLWRENNKLDGKNEHILGNGNGLPLLFDTRSQAREYLEARYGYIRNRKDLKAEPFGWKMPIAVKIVMQFRLQPRDK